MFGNGSYEMCQFLIQHHGFNKEAERSVELTKLPDLVSKSNLKRALFIKYCLSALIDRTCTKPKFNLEVENLLRRKLTFK